MPSGATRLAAHCEEARRHPSSHRPMLLHVPVLLSLGWQSQGLGGPRATRPAIAAAPHVRMAAPVKDKAAPKTFGQRMQVSHPLE